MVSEAVSGNRLGAGVVDLSVQFAGDVVSDLIRSFSRYLYAYTCMELAWQILAGYL